MKDFTLTNFEAVRLLHRSYFSPLVESIRRNEATFGKDRISKCRCLCHGLRPSVERPISDAHVFCPGWNQSPTHGCEVANLFALFFADDQDGLRWRNVVSRMLFNFIIRHLKTFSKILLRVRQSVSVTHSLLSQIQKRSHSPSAHTLAAKLWMISEFGGKPRSVSNRRRYQTAKTK